MGLLTRFAETYDYNYASSYSDNMATGSNGSDSAYFGLMFMIFMIIFFVVIYVIFAIFLAKIFKKAGVEGWKAWVPIYNNWVMLELGRQKGWWILFSLIPFVGIVSVVFTILAAINIGKSLGKENWFVLIYLFAPIVWVIWLAVDKSTWVPEGSVPAVAGPAYPMPATEYTPPATDQTPPSPPVNPLVQ